MDNKRGSSDISAAGHIIEPGIVSVFEISDKGMEINIFLDTGLINSALEIQNLGICNAQDISSCHCAGQGGTPIIAETCDGGITTNPTCKYVTFDTSISDCILTPIMCEYSHDRIGKI